MFWGIDLVAEKEVEAGKLSTFIHPSAIVHPNAIVAQVCSSCAESLLLVSLTAMPIYLYCCVLVSLVCDLGSERNP